MYFVYLISNIGYSNTLHSGWNTLEEAQNQTRVLRDYGYKGVSIKYRQGLTCENGQYFV